MSYPIEKIEGIGPVYAAKLAPAGIKTTQDLLTHAATPAGRAALAETTGITEHHILKWANIADLMRINGVGEEFSELLEAAGVDTVKELKHRVPAHLHEKLAEVNEARKLTRQVPGLSQVTNWIEQAKTMEPILSY